MPNGYLKIFIIFATAFFFPLFLNAQSVYLYSNESNIYTDDFFVVNLFIDTGGSKINVVSGNVVAGEVFEIVDLRHGDSVLSLWPSTPTIENGRSVPFAGGVAGGFAGSSGKLMTLLVRAKNPGRGTISVDDLKFLLHDGNGTELNNVTSKIISLYVSPRPSGQAYKTSDDFILFDTVSPEIFIPEVTKVGIEGNKYFISFHAVDKLSGIDRYEITERPFILSLIPAFSVTRTVSSSPLILAYQVWPASITVKAIDRAGNSAEIVARKPYDLHVISGIFVLLLLVLSVVFIRLRRKLL
jgi:hypothetical protein